MIFSARHSESKITADRANGLKVRFDTHATPGETLRSDAFLDAGREGQILFCFFLALFQLLVRCAKLLLGSLLVGNLRKCDYTVLAPIRGIHRSRANDHRQATPIFFGKTNSKRVCPCFIPLSLCLAITSASFGE